MRLDRPLPPNSTIGILGGGQLGRMLALAAARLGLKCHVYAPDLDSPAFQVAAQSTVASYDDHEALAGFSSTVDAVTFEFENVPAGTAAFLAGRVPLAPGAEALRVAQDRLIEKEFIAGLGLPVAPFAAVGSEAELQDAVGKIGHPAILKTRRFGYDGKGQAQLGPDPRETWRAIGGAPAILEGFVSFDREISVIAARGRDGRIAAYDVPENVHRHHILHTSTVPARISAATAAAAREAASRIMSALGYVGVIGVEMFVSGEEIVVNEIAPRVHNSGHWTLDACHVSQFEQHMRAVAGWPLGHPARHSDVVMTNLIGDDVLSWKSLAAEPSAAVHLYGKSEWRPGRKMGHVNRLTPRQA
jgi:5-(carboxyamino)imidazole ribonucleotide synthase